MKEEPEGSREEGRERRGGKGWWESPEVQTSVVLTQLGCIPQYREAHFLFLSSLLTWTGMWPTFSWFPSNCIYPTIYVNNTLQLMLVNKGHSKG
jgi:hypothetical protein